MAVMINSYKAESILTRVPSCRLIAACDLGGRGAEHGTSPPGKGGHRVIHVFSVASSSFSLPVHLKSGADALAAGGLAEIGQRGGNLEWAKELLFGAKRIMCDRVVSDTRQSRAERCPGRQDVEFDRSFVVKYLSRSGPGGRRQSHKWHVSRPRGGLAERFGDRIRALQGNRETAAEGNRLLERSANLALLVEGAAPRIHISEVLHPD